MKIPYGWVREFVDLGLAPAEAADRLVNAGIEVASIEPAAPPLPGVVVGLVEAVGEDLGVSHGHRLRVCHVTTGAERCTVVCGAPNVRAGAGAALARPGAELPGGRRVEATTLRGVESRGMLCSERELGLGEEHEAGILLLDDDAPVGAAVTAALGLDDQVLEIEITPNRPDCLSVVGVARELAALTGARLRAPDCGVRESDERAADLARVRIEDPGLCARYAARVVSGVRVGPSPARLAARLRAVGLRPISNVVDATNYVLWELGHPLHAFDHATVRQATIVVRRARPGERLTTLDGQERSLTDAMLVIADPDRAIALAGVMGGANTEVTAGTTRVLLESAWFDPGSVRRTSRALGLSTDAAYRFERGADVEALAHALDRTAQLIADLGGGRVARGRVDAYPAPRPRPRVRLRLARVERVLGVAPPRAEVTRILAGLGLPVEEGADGVEVEVPTFRRDIAIEDDLVEEVVRVWGYDRIPSTLPGGAIGVVRQPLSLRQASEVWRALAGAGLHEIVAYRFGDPALDPAADDAVALLNPLSQDASRLRRHPLEGVLGAAATNLRRQQPDVAVFELGKVYRRRDGGSEEPRQAALALAGARRGAGWSGGSAAVDVYDAKGLAEHVLEALGVRGWQTVQAGVGWLEPDCAGAMVTDVPGVGRVPIAWFGEVTEAVRERFGIRAPVFGAWVALDDVARLATPPVHYRPLPRFPAVRRDLAFVLEGEPALSAADVETAIRREAGPLLRDLALFDVFAMDGGRRSLAWRLTFQADDRTLTDDEVNAIHERVARRVAGEFHIAWRGA